jgi:hypothetical protein
VANLVDLKKFLEIWQIWWVFKKFLEMWQIWWIFFFTKENPLRGAWPPHHFFLQVVTLECIFQPFFLTVLRKIDWNVQLCEHNHGLGFLGGVEDFSRLRSLRRFWTFLCCVVLRACGMEESLLFIFFPFLSSSRVATNCGVTHACTLPRSIAPSVQAAAWASPPLPPQPPLVTYRAY